MNQKYFLAVDIGASSGRHMVRREGSDYLDEVYRFQNYMDMSPNGLIWDIERLYDEVKKGIKIASDKYPDIVSLGIDTWGVDYVLLEDGKIKEPVYAYRNNRTQESIPKVHELIPYEKLYEISGTQFYSFNSIYQLYWDKMNGRLNTKTRFLLLPQYFYYKLTGVMIHEYTGASTTGLVNARTGQYDQSIIQSLDFPNQMFPEIHQPGHVSKVKDEITKELGFKGDVILVASHDTASAVESIDIPDDSVYISSGTWSILGVKIKEPVINKKTIKGGFSHEGGVGYIRFLKNIMGLWMIQELEKEFKIKSFESIVETAKASSYTKTFDVNADHLMAPESMSEAICKTLMKDYGSIALNQGDIFNSVFHSLAKSYKEAIMELENITGKNYKRIVIFGGGANNQYLNQLVEKYTNKVVEAHPIEATTIGNLNIQENQYKEKS